MATAIPADDGREAPLRGPRQSPYRLLPASWRLVRSLSVLIVVCSLLWCSLMA